MCQSVILHRLRNPKSETLAYPGYVLWPGYAVEMNREDDPELALRQSVLYAVGFICEDAGWLALLSVWLTWWRALMLLAMESAAQKQRQARPKPAPTKDTLLVLADLVLKQAESEIGSRLLAVVHRS